MNWKNVTAGVIAKTGGIGAIIVGILGFLFGLLIAVVGGLLCLTIILAILGLPALIFGCYLMAGSAVIVWAGVRAVLWKPAFEDQIDKENGS